MSFKVNRIKSEKESYKTTVNWLNDFSKSANFQDRIKERRDRPVVEKFSTIEDKMEDIKARVGFSNIKTAEDYSYSLSKYASAGSCGCETENCECEITKPEICEVCQSESCSCESIKKDLAPSCVTCSKSDMISKDPKLQELKRKIEGLLIYIEELIKDRQYSTSAEVYGYLQSQPDISHADIFSKIDHEKFGNFLEKMFSKYKRSDFDHPQYISRDELANDSLDDKDGVPSYFQSGI